MLTNSLVTIYRSTDGGRYSRIGTCPAWVYRQSRLRSEDGGAYRRDIFDVRIPSEHAPEILAGDVVFFGGAEDSYPDLSRCCRISAVTENTAGSCPHIHFEAENQYR